MPEEENRLNKSQQSRSAWASYYKSQGLTPSLDERRTLDMLIDRGIMPIVGGSDEKKNTSSRELSVGQREDIFREAVWEAEDLYDGLGNLIERMPEAKVKQAIDEAGEGFIVSMTDGLSEDMHKGYMDSLQKLKSQDSLEARNGLSVLLKEIKKTRQERALDEPGVKPTKKEREALELENQPQ